MEGRNRELLYSGAFGAGKTRVGCEKGKFLSDKYPGNKGLIIRKAFVDLRATTMDTWFRYVCPKEHIASYNKQEHELKLTNGSEVLFLGMDQASRIGSLEVGWIFCDEVTEFLEEDYKMLLGRIRLPTVPFSQIFGATNPADQTHWLYKRFYKDMNLKSKGITKVVESNSFNNPFTPKAYREHLDTLTGRYRERYIEGKWISFEGLVYDNWDPREHILPRDTTKLGLTGDKHDPIPDDWERFRGIDFGFTNPFVCQWWASPKYKWVGEPGQQDQVEIPIEERVFVRYREIYHSRRTTNEHAEDILEYGENIKISFADWDAGDREILARAGVPTNHANKDISSGIQTVYDMIGHNRIYFLEGSLVRPDSELGDKNKPTCTEEEFSLYNRPKGSDGKIDPKEDPIKLNDHGMDTMRYLFHSMKASAVPKGSVRHSKVSEIFQKSEYHEADQKEREKSRIGLPIVANRVKRNRFHNNRREWQKFKIVS